MHLTWKRPDGFHNAQPSDYYSIELDGKSKLWLHKEDKDQYPFRLAGDWEEKDHTVRLNNLVNLIGEPTESIIGYLKSTYNHSMNSNLEEYYNEVYSWVRELKNFLKGDTWETDILSQAIDTTLKKLEAAKEGFLKS